MTDTIPTKDKNWFARHRVLTVIGVIFILGIIGSATNGDKGTQNTTTQTPSSETTLKAEETKAEAKKPDVPPEYTSALNQADSYSKTLHLSKKGVYDQLVSPYGGQFSAESAQYAVDNVKADWNANAVASAKSYQKTLSMSPAAIHDQLTSEYGAKFTVAEADYAVAHLND